MAGVAVDLGVGDAAPVMHQREDNLARAGRREAPVGGEAGDQETGAGAGEGRGEVAAVGVGRVEVVERLGRQQIGVGVEEAGELVALSYNFV